MGYPSKQGTVVTHTARPKFDRYGRYDIDGMPHTRATTIAKTLDDLESVHLWQQRKLIAGLVLRPDLVARGAAAGSNDRFEIDNVREQALEAGGANAARNIGTAVHRFTERLDRREEVEVPAPFDRDVAAYRNALEEANIRVIRELHRVPGSRRRAGRTLSPVRSTAWSKSTAGALCSTSRPASASTSDGPPLAPNSAYTRALPRS